MALNFNENNENENYFTIQEFFKELKNIKSNTRNQTPTINQKDLNNSISNNGNTSSFSIHTYLPNSKNNFEIKNLKEENEELNFCLNQIKTKFIIYLKKLNSIYLSNKQKLNNIKNNLDNNANIIKVVNGKLQNYDKLIALLEKSINENLIHNKINEEMKYKINKLEKELSNSNEIISKLNFEIKNKDRIIEEIKEKLGIENKNLIEKNKKLIEENDTLKILNLNLAEKINEINKETIKERNKENNKHINELNNSFPVLNPEKFPNLEKNNNNSTFSFPKEFKPGCIVEYFEKNNEEENKIANKNAEDIEEINEINNNEIENNEIDNNEINDSSLEVNKNFSLYKPYKDGVLVFNLFKKKLYTVVPEKYSDFYSEYKKLGSLQYNTLEGLFILNSNNNKLYYYSGKKNSFNELFAFNNNHSYGCLFLDNLSKNIIAISGKFTNTVELFSFESGIIENLPNLNSPRSEMSCCQVNTKIYIFFGKIEKKEDAQIQFLDMENKNSEWVKIDYVNKTSFKGIYGISCLNLNDSEILIIGGNLDGDIANEKIIYFNVDNSELVELDKNLPDSDEKNYLFTENNMFNLFLNEGLISYTNIDDRNNVHVIDNELKYDLYLSPIIEDNK